MKRIFLLLLIMLLQLPTVYSEEQPVITVFDFQYSENLTESEMTSIISLLSSELFKRGKFTVLDIQQRDTLLGEMQFSLSGLTNEQNLLEIGKMLSAESIVTGKIGMVGGRIVLSAKMLETETAKIESTADGVYDDIAQLLDDIQLIAETLAGIQEAKRPVLLEEDLSSQQLTKAPDKNRAWSYGTMGLGIALLGSGTYLVLDSVDKLNQLKDAEEAYMTASTDFDTLYMEYMDAYDNAADSNDQFIFGASLMGGGAVSCLVSTILFIRSGKEKRSAPSVFILPGGKGTTIGLGFTY